MSANVGTRKVEFWTVRTLSDLDRIRERWNSLELAASSPMQHFEWSRASAAVFSQRGDLYVAVVGDDHRCSAIAPLIRTKGLFSSLELIGINEISEPMDFLYEDVSMLTGLLRGLAKRGIALRLSRVPAESSIVSAIRASYAGRGWVRISPGRPYPYIDLTPGWTEPESQFNPRRRSDFRRAQRHGRDAGDVTFEILSPEEVELSTYLDEAFAVEARSWKGIEGTALAVDALRAPFFRQYAEASRAKGILRLAFMRINGQAVAMQIALECHNRFWLLKIGYDAKYSRCSPGTLLMLHSIKSAASRGLQSYEFLGGVAPWTSVWTRSHRDCVVIRSYPLSVSGAAALASDTMHWGINRLGKMLEAHREKTTT